jgi:S-adenosylmethionine decarboxylase proenzyme
MSTPPTTPFGTHSLSELSGCAPEKLSNAATLSHDLHAAALAANATVVSSSFQRFGTAGVSGALNLADAQIAVRTWPEFGYAALDIFGGAGASAIRDALAAALGAKSVQSVEIERGISSADGIFRNRVVASPTPASVASATLEDPTTGKTVVRKRYTPSPINLS